MSGSTSVRESSGAREIFTLAVICATVMGGLTLSGPLPSSFHGGSPGLDLASSLPAELGAVQGTSRAGTSLDVGQYARYEVPITIDNTQSVATAAPFQQLIPVDSAAYASYEARNLSNVEFLDSSGGVLDSWLESGNTSSSSNTLYWVKLPSGIPARSSVVIYLAIGSKSANLFNAATTGEAPELSSVYAEYDNGADIFTTYQNFASSSDTLPSGWYSTGQQGPCSYVYAENLLSVQGENGCGVLDAGSNIPVNSSVAVDIEMFDLQTTCVGACDWQAPFVNSASPTSYEPQGDAVNWIDDDDAPCNSGGPGYGDTQYATLTLSSSPGGTSLGTSPTTFPITVITVTNSSVLANYSRVISGSGILDKSGYLALAVHTTSGCGSGVWTYWVRERALPPNGVMPAVTLGALKPIENTVTFSESGLPAKTLARRGWSVVLNGTVQHSTASTVSFVEAPGAYPVLITGPSGYRVSGIAPGGTIQVNGANLTESFHFQKGRTYSLRFSERGLPKGQSWCVEVEGWQTCATKAVDKYSDLTNGSYAYSVLPMNGQTITAKERKSSLPLSGILSVARNERVSLTYAHPYAVTFTETGLSSGTWSVTLKGHTESEPWNQTIQFNLTNGTYSYRVGPEAGYKSIGTPAKIAVNGATVTATVTFSKAR